MNRVNKIAAFLKVLLLSCSLLFSAVSAAAVLQSLQASTDTVGTVWLKLNFDSAAPTPQTFTTLTPFRIILDLPAVSLALPNSKQEIGLGPLQEVVAVATKQRSRVVLSLSEQKTYEVFNRSNEILVAIKNDRKVSKKAHEKKIATRKLEKSKVAEVQKNSHLTAVDFKRNSSKAGLVVLGLSYHKIAIDIEQRGKKVFLRILETALPEKFAQRLDVTDFSTPVKHIDFLQRGKDIEVIISNQEDYEYMVYQADNLLTVEVQPFSQAQKKERARRNKVYEGQRLSLNFQDIEVRSVLQLIADFTSNNMVASDSVQGRVTLRLENVPWDQALDIILRAKGLAMRKNGNVIMVAPAAEIAARERAELEASQQALELAPLRSEFMQINYAKAADIALLLKGETNSLLSARGNVSVDERTNILLVQDTAAKLDEVREIIKQLDTSVQQVEIEARIVNAQRNFSKNLGIKWGSGKAATVGKYNLGIGANINDSSALANGTVVEPTRAAINDRLNVNLPLSTATSSLAFSIGTIGNVSMLDLELSAAAAETLTHVIASPKLITSNQKEATIKQGRQIPYLEASSSGATSVSFRDAVLELKVVPQITPDSHIIMDLTVKQDVVSNSLTVVNSNELPIIDTKEVTTQVLVDNGETVVLGGVYERNENKGHRKVPFFGDLPLISFLFKDTSNSDDRDELLIFVTPKIVVSEADRY